MAEGRDGGVIERAARPTLAEVEAGGDGAEATGGFAVDAEVGAKAEGVVAGHLRDGALVALVGASGGGAAVVGELGVGAVVDVDDGEGEAGGVGQAGDVGDEGGGEAKGGDVEAARVGVSIGVEISEAGADVQQQGRAEDIDVVEDGGEVLLGGDGALSNGGEGLDAGEVVGPVDAAEEPVLFGNGVVEARDEAFVVLGLALHAEVVLAAFRGAFDVGGGVELEHRGGNGADAGSGHDIAGER